MNNLNYVDAVIVHNSFKYSFECIFQAFLGNEFNIQHEVVDEIERNLSVLELTMVKEKVHVVQSVVSFELKDVNI